jgi:hypothetical protein
MRFSWKALGIGALVAGVALLLASLVPALESASAQPATPPNRFFGNATLDGAAAPAGTNVTASIGGVNCGQTTVEADSSYVLDVVSSGQTAGCGTEGASVSFTVGGCDAGTGTWSGGQFTQLDLAGVCAPPVVPTAAPPAVATATPVVVTGTGGYLGGDSGTPSWAYLAGGLSLLLTAAGGLAVLRRRI